MHEDAAQVYDALAAKAAAAPGCKTDAANGCDEAKAGNSNRR
jgi:hypothetical protein